MKLTLDTDTSLHLIDAYHANKFIVRGKEFTQTLALAPDRIKPEIDALNVTALSSDLVQEIIAWGPEILILGTGERQEFPPAWCYQLAARAQVGVEVMDTGAACRTYNVLAGEKRNVAALLILTR